jgi:putative Mg2+ transporter-C (MgtC) family protein
VTRLLRKYRHVDCGVRRHQEYSLTATLHGAAHVRCRYIPSHERRRVVPVEPRRMGCQHPTAMCSLGSGLGRDDMTGDADLALRLVVAFALTFALGFERQLRGSPAGDRTFALIGVATAVIGVLAQHNAPNALAGAVTGVGFIGASLAFRQNSHAQEVVRGITTGSAIFAAACIGAAAGQGFLVLALVATILVMLILELQHLPVLSYVDARRWQARFRNDEESRSGTSGPADPGE